MNKQSNKKIGWCDATVNPVVGCPRLCGAEFDKNGKMIKKPWCYAYNINERFHIVKDFSKPEFFPERLKDLYSKKPKVIFMDSMSDREFWKPEWVADVYLAIRDNPQHTYLVLTKGGSITSTFTVAERKNVFYGYSYTKRGYIPHCDFLSIEPILEPLQIADFKNIQQIIIGAQTGNRKDKVVPQKEWMESLVKQADEFGVKVFMKDSLIPIVGEENMRRELIWKK